MTVEEIKALAQTATDNDAQPGQFILDPPVTVMHTQSRTECQVSAVGKFMKSTANDFAFVQSGLRGQGWYKVGEFTPKDADL